MSQGKITTHIRLIQSLPRNVFIFKRWTNNFLTIIHLRRNLLTKIMTQRKRFRNESRNQIHSKSISCGAFFYLSFFQLWNYLQPRWKKKNVRPNRNTLEHRLNLMLSLRKYIYNPKTTNTFQCREQSVRCMR